MFRQAKEILLTYSPELEAQIDLILIVLQKMLDNKHSRVEIVLTPESTTKLEGKLHDRIARVISKTFLEKGEAAELTDDAALELIRELLLDYDETIVLRNEGKPLRRWRTRVERENFG